MAVETRRASAHLSSPIFGGDVVTLTGDHPPEVGAPITRIDLPPMVRSPHLVEFSRKPETLDPFQ
jgi:hypothetical protein